MPALGKKPYVEDERDFKLKAVEVALPGMPSRPFGFGSIYTDWKMLGNDKVGDCVLAGADHEHMMWNKVVGHAVSFTAANALADYSAITGYNPSDPNSDQGTEVRAAMGYRRSTGVIDSKGKRHKIEAYVSIDPKDWELMIRSCWSYGAVGIGFEFPATADKQWENGEIWAVTDPNSKIEGGHYVPIVGSRDPHKEATCITWGKKQFMTREFYEKYNDEAWVPLTKESITEPQNIRNIDWTKLEEMLGTLG